MSHFITAVITKDPHKYEEELALYQENNMGDCPKQFLEFVDQTEEFRKTWQEDSIERVKLPNGNYIKISDDRLKVEITEEEYKKLREEGVHVSSELKGTSIHRFKYDISVVNGTLVKIPYRDIYPTLKEYVEDCEGEDYWDKEMKAYGYWRNPNSKWDYYSLCELYNYGRWQDANIDKAFCKVKDYALYKDLEKLKKEYNDALEKSKENKSEAFLFKYNYGKFKDADDYAQKCRITAPWAFVLDKHWAERGEMGWWGMNDATDDSEDAFVKLFEKVMTDPQYQDYYIGFVDCHI